MRIAGRHGKQRRNRLGLVKGELSVPQEPREDQEGGYWVEVKVETTLTAAEMVGEILTENGCGGVVYHDPFLWRELSEEEKLAGGAFQTGMTYAVSGYLPLDDELDRRLFQIKKNLEETRKHLPVGSGEISLNRVREKEWANAWKEHFHPIRVGRVLITPTWRQVSPGPGEVMVSLDPGMAFGTGRHPSTQLALELLSDSISGQETVYDIGTGSGVLAISAAKLGAATVTAVDIDSTAIAVASENIRWNRMEERARVVKGNLLAGLAAGVDLVVANIIAEVIIEMAPEAARVIRPGGAFLSSGIIQEKAGMVRGKLEETGFDIEKEVTASGWTAFLARRKIHA